MADLYAAVYNPDVLSCLANLSNDEVFTPPELANQVLDMLPEEIWKDPNARFLDPCSKTGIFLREIAKRLIRGQMPDFDRCMAVIDHKRANNEELSAVDLAYLDRLQPVLDHIFREQVFGIGITQLTAQMTRRSLYCSKWANGKYSVVEFDSSEGNVRYRNLQHTWVGAKGKEKCKWCGVPRATIEKNRTSDESHAYELIHTPNPEVIYDMQFDVIVGNPPYQLNDGGGEGSSALPLYNRFIEQAEKLNPRFLEMIIPARWYSGGKGLDSFRDMMLRDDRIRLLHDFPETSMCFPGQNIRGGVCYFLWERDYHGPTTVFNHSTTHPTSSSKRFLLEKGATTFIRYNDAISILNKVQSLKEETYDERVMARNPFGIPSNYSAFSKTPAEGSLKLYRSRRGSSDDKVVYIESGDVKKNKSLSQEWRVLVSKASPGGDDYPHAIFSTPLISEPGSVSTETYLVVDRLKSEEECLHLIDYMKTRFFRFLVSLIKTTQNISKGCFAFVPVQDLQEDWTDEKLYLKYGITATEQAFIESLIRPIE